MALMFELPAQGTSASRKDVGWADAELLLQMRNSEARDFSRSSITSGCPWHSLRTLGSCMNTSEGPRLWSHGETVSVHSGIPAAPTRSHSTTSTSQRCGGRPVISEIPPTKYALRRATHLGKRNRACDDVDGEQTSMLSCKKRRLRRDLVTSRLSRPFSSPATHILNREAVLNSEKGFLRLTAAMNAKRVSMTASATLSFMTINDGNADSSMRCDVARAIPPAPPTTGPARGIPTADMLRRLAIFNQTRLHTSLCASRPSSSASSQPASDYRRDQGEATHDPEYILDRNRLAPNPPPPAYIPRIIAPLGKEEEIDLEDQPSFPAGDQPFLYDDELEDEFDDDDDMSLDFSVVFGGGDVGEQSEQQQQQQQQYSLGHTSTTDTVVRKDSAADEVESQPPSPMLSPSRFGVGDILEDAMDDLDGIPAFSRTLV